MHIINAVNSEGVGYVYQVILNTLTKPCHSLPPRFDPEIASRMLSPVIPTEVSMIARESIETSLKVANTRLEDMSSNP
jgi:hypothetical protein